MRVLIIAQYFPPDMGGGATRAFNVAKGLLKVGCSVTVVSAFPHYPRGEVPKKYRWKPLSMEFEGSLKIIRTFVPPLASQGLMKRILLFASFLVSSLFALPFVSGVDVVWAANPNVISFFSAVLYGFAKRKPVALNVDDLWPEELHNSGLVNEESFVFKLMHFFAKLAYLKAGLITPISPGYVEVLCRNYGVNRERVHVARAGVDLDTFRLVDYKPNYDEEDFRVLYSGAFSVAYDFDQVFLAARALENVDGVEFVLQGGGELAGHMKSRVEALKLGNVRIIDRIISRAEVAKLLSDADALILPLRDFGKPYSGISSKLYEYQAAGKPIICCANGQPAEYVKETGSGIVVKPGDVKDLAKVVVKLHKDRKLAAELGWRGRCHVSENLSPEKIGSRIQDIFVLVMDGKS